MAKYEHKKRQGFMVYHSDYRNLVQRLPEDQQIVLFVNLEKVSETIAAGEPEPQIFIDDLATDLVFRAMKEKIIRDNESYESTCRTRALARAQGKAAEADQIAKMAKAEADKLTEVDNSQQ